MREILFKAKRIDNGEWVEGIPIQTHIGLFMCFDENPHYCHQYGYMEIDGIIKVDETTICQYTGLTDKNGRKIWENDILMCHGNKDDLIKAVFGKFDVIDAFDLEVIDRVIGWHYKVIPTDGLSRMRPFNLPMPLTDSYVESLNLKVIGNVFDNSELLEKAR